MERGEKNKDRFRSDCIELLPPYDVKKATSLDAIAMASVRVEASILACCLERTNFIALFGMLDHLVWMTELVAKQVGDVPPFAEELQEVKTRIENVKERLAELANQPVEEIDH